MTKPLPLSGYEPIFTYDPWGSSGKVHDNCYDYAFDSFSKSRRAKSVPGDRAHINSMGLTFTTCRGIATRILKDNPGAVYQLKNPAAQCKPGYYKIMCFVAPTNDFGNATGDFHFLKQVQGVRYRIRPGDTVLGLAKFFHVKPDVIRQAIKNPTKPASPNNGRISNSNLTQLNKNNEAVRKLKTTKVTSRLLPPGTIIKFPVNLWAHKQGWAGGPLLVDASGKTIVDPRKANLNYHPGFHYSKFCSAWAVRRGVAQTGNNTNRN